MRASTRTTSASSRGRWMGVLLALSSRPAASALTLELSCPPFAPHRWRPSLRSGTGPWRAVRRRARAPGGCAGLSFAPSSYWRSSVSVMALAPFAWAPVDRLLIGLLPYGMRLAADPRRRQGRNDRSGLVASCPVCVASCVVALCCVVARFGTSARPRVAKCRPRYRPALTTHACKIRALSWQMPRRPSCGLTGPWEVASAHPSSTSCAPIARKPAASGAPINHQTRSREAPDAPSSPS